MARPLVPAPQTPSAARAPARVVGWKDISRSLPAAGGLHKHNTYPPYYPWDNRGGREHAMATRQVYGSGDRYVRADPNSTVKRSLARSRWRASTMHERMHPCGLFLARPRQTPQRMRGRGRHAYLSRSCILLAHHQRRMMRAAQHTGVRTWCRRAGGGRHCLTQPGLVRLLSERARGGRRSTKKPATSSMMRQ